MELKPSLTIAQLWVEAKGFAERETNFGEPALYGVTDGKAVGTYLEQKLKLVLQTKFMFVAGNSGLGIDFPELNVDIKVTSIKQPQSSCPFKSARQKVFGLGYHLIIFVYNKEDDHELKTARLKMLHVLFVDAAQTGDYTTTMGIRGLLEDKANEEDLIAYMNDRNLPIDDIQASMLAVEILEHKPEVGYLTISNALQWRLNYGRAIQMAGVVSGIERIF